MQNVSKYDLCLLVGVFLFLFHSQLNAQEGSDDKVFNVFLNGGLCSSQISGDQLSGFKQVGFTTGIGTEIVTQSNWKPQIEILFTQKGSRKNASPDQGDHESYLLRLNYIEVPIQVGYRYGSTGFELGISPAYLLGHKEENQNGIIPGINRDFKSYDLSGTIGIRYRFKEDWELATRFSQSILAVRDHAGGSSFRLNQGQYNTSIQFILRFYV